MKSHLIADTRPAHRFRPFLQAELARRCTRNQRYSLRAFARDLALDHSTLSQLLRGRRRLTTRTIQRIGRRLGLSPAMITRFIALERNGHPAELAPPVRELSREAANALAEWHHHAILELTHLTSFRPDSRWIARVLDIPVDTVNVAVTHLARLGLLQMTSRATWRDTAGDAIARIDGTSPHARVALTPRDRILARSTGESPAHYSATTVAVTAATIHDVADRVERFRQEIAAVLARDSGGRDQVYCLELAFFPLANLTITES